MQRSNHPAGSQRRIQGVGLFERPLVQVLDRVQPGTGLVESFDSVDVAVHDLPTSDRPAFHCGMCVLDRGLEQLEALGPSLGRDRDEEGDRE